MKKIAESAWCAPGVVLSGDVEIGENSSVWYNSVVRATKHTVKIGNNTNIQDGCVVHTSTGHGVTIGDDVTIGHGAIIHCKEIGDNVLVGMGATLLSGAVIGKNCIIGAGALVKEKAEIPDNSLVVGMPAKVIRTLDEKAWASIKYSADAYAAKIGEEKALIEAGEVTVY